MTFNIKDNESLLSVPIKSRTDGTDQVPVHQIDDLFVITVTPTIQAASYSNGEVLWTTSITLTNVMAENAGEAELLSVVLLDKADADSNTSPWGVTLVFFDQAKSLGTVNTSPTISDADMLQALGTVTIASGDFVDVGLSRLATKPNIRLPMKADTASKNLYVGGLIASGNPTFGSTSDIVIKFGFRRG